MSDDALSSADSLRVLLSGLATLDASITSEKLIEQGKLGELRRQARARPHRRGRGGEIDTRKYAIGGAFVLLAGEIDATTFLGFLAQTDMMLRWMGEARLTNGPCSFGDLIRGIFADPRKAQWCRRWGGLIAWSHRKALYDASVTSFELSGRTGLNERWRRDPTSDDQADLIATLCTVLDEPMPALANKGEAYEWIKKRGGNPSYWVPPPHPDNWSDEDGHDNT